MTYLARPSISSSSSLGDLQRPRSSLSSLSLHAWPVPPFPHPTTPFQNMVGLPLEMDTMPFSGLFADDLLDETTAEHIPKRVLSPKKSNISIKTYVLEDSVVSQVVVPNGQCEDRWLSRRKSILPTITEQDDQTERCTIATQSINESDQPFEVDLENCLLTSIVRGGTPQPETTLLYAAQLVASISSLHAAGIVHGLINPETVAIRDTKYLVLCDCKRRARGTTSSFKRSPLRGHDHQRMYLYHAPEIVLGWTPGFSIDSWGFGIVMYYMLIGFHPFGDRDGQEDRIVNAKSHALRYLDLVENDARDLVSKCLERNPALRPSISEIKVHPYFSTIEWSKMITRYVRVPPDGESLAFSPSSALPRSMLPSPVDLLRKTSQAKLASGLALTILGNNARSEPSVQPPTTTVNHGPLLSGDTIRSEWFLSSTDLNIASEPEGKPSRSEELNTSGHDNRDRRMELFWGMLDSEQDTQPASVPADDLLNTLTYFTSRPGRLRKRQPSAIPTGSQLSSWRSSIEVSSTRIKEKNKPAILESRKEETETITFPPGIERIGNGIGYALPAASRSKVSICSTVPRSCHGFFGSSPKFSRGLKAKPKSMGNLCKTPKAFFGTSRTETSPEASPEWNMSPFCDNNTTTVIYASSRPTLTNAIPTNSPQQDSESEDSDEVGPLTPDTIALESSQEKGGLTEDDAVLGITETPTLRLVSKID